MFVQSHDLGMYNGYPSLRAPHDKQAETCALNYEGLLSVMGNIHPFSVAGHVELTALKNPNALNSGAL